MDDERGTRNDVINRATGCPIIPARSTRCRSNQARNIGHPVAKNINIHTLNIVFLCSVIFCQI